jgi:hypothetical protein
MIRLNFKNVNTNKLHDELMIAGIRPIKVESTGLKEQEITAIPPDTWITIEDNQENAVNAIVVIHDPTILPISITAEERISALETLVLELGGVI